MAIILPQTRGHKPLARSRTQHSLPAETQRGREARHRRQRFQRSVLAVEVAVQALEVLLFTSVVVALEEWIPAKSLSSFDVSLSTV